MAPVHHPRRTLLAAAVTFAIPAALVGSLAAASEDATVRKALSRVQATYLEPDRIDPEVMLRGALESAGRFLAADEGASAAEPSPVTCSGVREAVALANSLGPCFEEILDAAVGTEPGASPRRDRLRAALLDGALRTLDRFSGAYTAAARRNLMGRFQGTGSGIGVRIGRREGDLRILEVFAGSGAAEAGLLPGDILARVAGEDVGGLAVAEVSRLLRGEVGTRVEVEVERDGPLGFSIERRNYVRPTVRGEILGEDLGIIRITHLSRNTEEQVAATMQELFREHRIRRILLDLRGNTGGSMLTAAAIADLFLRHGVLLEALDRNDRPVPGLRARVEASRRGWDRIPLAVLVNGSTGSSAELLAAALAWNDRALLIGEPTFGKNIVQKMHQFDEVDLTVKISSAYMKAAGRRLPADGLPPDVWVEPGGGAPPQEETAIVRQPPEGGDSWERLALAILDAHADASRSVMIDGLRGDAAAEAEAVAPGAVPDPGRGS